VKTRIEALVSQVSEIIVGKTGPIRLAVACLLARGHLLIEDVPGVGKNHAFARPRSLARPEFPADSVYERSAASRYSRKLHLRS
jgi:MoxR-like ATPase